MYWSSPSERRGCSCGRRYTRSHKTSQVALKNPVKRKAQRHPRCTATQGTVSGAIMAPTFVPELKTPVASARSFFGNHSVTVFIAAGKFPDSPSPNMPRAKANPKTELASACPIAARLQIAIETA